MVKLMFLKLMPAAQEQLLRPITGINRHNDCTQLTINFDLLPGFDTLFFELQDSKSLVNVTSWVLDKHTVKFGGEARLIRTDNLQPIEHRA